MIDSRQRVRMIHERLIPLDRLSLGDCVENAPKLGYNFIGRLTKEIAEERIRTLALKVPVNCEIPLQEGYAIIVAVDLDLSTASVVMRSRGGFTLRSKLFEPIRAELAERI